MEGDHTPSGRTLCGPNTGSTVAGTLAICKLIVQNVGMDKIGRFHERYLLYWDAP